MIKKIFSFVCCLVPFGAMAVPVQLDQSGTITLPPAGFDFGQDSYYIANGNAFNSLNITSGTMTMTGNMRIWSDATPPANNALYINNGAGTETGVFNLVSAIGIDVGGTLRVDANANGRTFVISSSPSSAPINTTFGNIENNGKLEFKDIENLKIGVATNGALINTASLIVDAAGLVQVGGDMNLDTGSTTKITAASTISANGIRNQGTATLTANALSTAQNLTNESSGQVAVNTTGGGVTIGGSLINRGTALSILPTTDAARGVVTVAGNMSNESNAGNLTITAQSLTVNGVDASGNSFVNNGNFTLNATNAATFAGGINLAGMKENNTFSVTAGQFLVGGGNLQNLFTNNLTSFKINVTAGDLDYSTADVYNQTTDAANAANMDLTASGAINVRSVRSAGNNLTIKANDITVAGTNYTGAPVAAGVIEGKAGASTTIEAGNTLTADATDNSGTMKLQAKTVTLQSLTNKGTLSVLGGPDGTGTLIVATDVANESGTMGIDVKEINVSGRLLNTGGDMNITKASQITLGGMDLSGGVVDITGPSVSAEKIDIIGGDMRLSRTDDVNGGILAVGGNIKTINVTKNASNVGGDVRIGGDILMSGNATPSAGDVVVAADTFTINADKGINVSGDINVIENASTRTLALNGATVDVGQNVMADGDGHIIIGNGATTNMTVGGNVSATNRAIIDMNITNAATVGSLTGNGKFIARGTTLGATSNIENAIDIQNGILFNGNDAARGLVITGANTFELGTSATDATMNVANGVTVGAGKTLTLNSQNAITLGGAIKNDGTLNINPIKLLDGQNAYVNNTGQLNISGYAITIGNIENTTGTVDIQGKSNPLSATSDSLIVTKNITNNSGSIILNGAAIESANVTMNGGSAAVSGRQWRLENLALNAGVTDLSLTAGVNATGNIDVTGDVVQRGATGPSGTLNILNNMTLAAKNMNVHGALRGVSGLVNYNIADAMTIDDQVIVNPAATVNITANRVTANDVENSGALDIVAQNGMTLGAITAKYGVMDLDSGASTINTTGLTTTNGGVNLKGAALTSSGAVELAGALTQNGGVGVGDANVMATDYIFSAPTVDATDIIQYDGKMTLNTGNLKLTGGIDAADLRIAAQDRTSSLSNNWLTVDVGGNVSGGVKFAGLKNMTIGGNYEFNNNSSIHAAIMPTGDSNLINYWSSVSLKDDNTLGTITNPTDGAALIRVGDTFISNVSQLAPDTAAGSPLIAPQVGIDIFKMVDQGSAIWLLHAQNGLNELKMGMRNVSVKFCNADGTRCFDYIDLSKPQYNGSAEGDLPVYLTTRDTNDDGVMDSIYIVFDPRFGGPVAVYKIQPIVNRTENHTDGEYVTAGALDNLVAGRLIETGFLDKTPIDAIPLIFEDTNMRELGRQLYDRMEYYNTVRDGTGLARFSRLFQPREMEQIVGSIVLNEHTTFRDFEDRMFDEFIWNRNRNLKKAWLDVDYGMFRQNVSDDKRVSGDRFSVAGGFDWQRSNTLIWGLTARVSHMSGDNSDTMDLGYKLNEHIAGFADVDVADTNIGLGGYMMKTLGTKARIYGNAFADIHLLDVTRHQTYVDKISGDGTAFALTTEWGLLHDILNQYIVGNLYARAGYNFGFSLTEKVGGETYMDMESDGYMILTPGYSLTAQKRIYPNAWMQLRPYASLGVEYDVLGAPDKAKFKFGPAGSYTDYHVELNPLWANVGGGLEFLMANGLQFGADYRYQYNSEIQLHNIRLSASYRF